MSSSSIARKEFAAAARSRLLIFVSLVFAGALLAVTIGYRLVAPRPRTGVLFVYIVELVRWLVPISALVAGYDAIVGERSAGTLRLLFGFPYTRGQVFLGKAIGRFAAVLTGVGIGFLATALVATIAFEGLQFGRFVLLFGAAALLAAAFVGIAVATSGASCSPVRVVAGIVAAFVGFLFLWDLLPDGAYFVLHGSTLGPATPPAWYVALERSNPVTSFDVVATAITPSMGAVGSGTGSFLGSTGFAVLVLLAWTGVPLAVSYVRFLRADLA